MNDAGDLPIPPNQGPENPSPTIRLQHIKAAVETSDIFTSDFKAAAANLCDFLTKAIEHGFSKMLQMRSFLEGTTDAVSTLPQELREERDRVLSVFVAAGGALIISTTLDGEKYIRFDFGESPFAYIVRNTGVAAGETRGSVPFIGPEDTVFIQSQLPAGVSNLESIARRHISYYDGQQAARDVTRNHARIRTFLEPLKGQDVNHNPRVANTLLISQGPVFLSP